MNKQKRNRLLDTENRLMVARGKGVRELGGNGKEIKKYNW